MKYIAEDRESGEKYIIDYNDEYATPTRLAAHVRRSLKRRKVQWNRVWLSRYYSNFPEGCVTNKETP